MSQAAVAPAPAGNKKMVIIIAAAVLVLGIAGGAAFFFMKGGKHEEAKQEEVVHESTYIDIKPEFVVNFRDKAGHSKFLKADLSVVTKDPEVEKAIEKHMPALRNTLVMLLSSQIYEDLLASEGKQKLRADALAGVQAVMQEQIGKPGIEDLFFSNFVMH